jgi:hypothetical protein
MYTDDAKSEITDFSFRYFLENINSVNCYERGLLFKQAHDIDNTKKFDTEKCAFESKPFMVWMIGNFFYQLDRQSQDTYNVTIKIFIDQVVAMLQSFETKCLALIQTDKAIQTKIEQNIENLTAKKTAMEDADKSESDKSKHQTSSIIKLGMLITTETDHLDFTREECRKKTIY